MLVTKPRILPLRANDGTKIFDVPAGTALQAGRPLKLAIPLEELPAQSYARLFLAENTSDSGVQLIMPAERDLQVK